MKSVATFFSKLSIYKTFLILITPLITILMDIRPALIGLAILLVLDFVTGVRKSFIVSEIKFNPLKKITWQKFSSTGMRQSWRKTYEYVIGILAFGVLEAFFIKGAVIPLGETGYKITEFAVIVAAIVELYSIFENIEQSGGTNVLKKLLDMVIPEKVKEKFIK